MKILNKIIEELNFDTDKIYTYDEVEKIQQEGDYYYDMLFSNKTAKFKLTTIHLENLREINGFSNTEPDDGDEFLLQTYSNFAELGMDEDELISEKLTRKILRDEDLNPMVIDENGKMLDGRHRLASYSEVYFYYGYDYSLDPNLQVFQRISN